MINDHPGIRMAQWTSGDQEQEALEVVRQQQAELGKRPNEVEILEAKAQYLESRLIWNAGEVDRLNLAVTALARRGAAQLVEIDRLDNIIARLEQKLSDYHRGVPDPVHNAARQVVGCIARNPEPPLKFHTEGQGCLRHLSFAVADLDRLEGWDK